MSVEDVMSEDILPLDGAILAAEIRAARQRVWLSIRKNSVSYWDHISEHGEDDRYLTGYGDGLALALAHIDDICDRLEVLLPDGSKINGGYEA